MKKFFRAFYFLLAALMLLSLSGCSGGDGESVYGSDSKEQNYEVKQVAVISSPALEEYGRYKIYVGSELSGMANNEQFYVANVGAESSQASLNLGLSTEISSADSIAVVNASTNSVVFAYNPSGVQDTWKTGGNVRYSGGKSMKYRSLTILTSDDVENDEADIVSASTSTAKGKTEIYIGTGSNLRFVKTDEQDYLPRSVNISDDVFRLERKVNIFSGIILR